VLLELRGVVERETTRACSQTFAREEIRRKEAEPETPNGDQADKKKGGK